MPNYKYKPGNPVGKGKTRITYNPGKPNETSVEFKRNSPPSSGTVPGTGMANKAAKAKEAHKRKLKKVK